MPFIASHKDTGERVDITEIENPRVELKKGDYVCPFCGELLFIKAGPQVTAHFAHYSQCTSDYLMHPESPDHLWGKKMLAKYLREYFSDYLEDISIEFEVKIEIGETKRIADLVMTFPMGWRVAHEIQLCSITADELQQRTEDYAKAGIDVVWWLGKSADTSGNRFWCLDQFGFSYRISFEEEERYTQLWRADRSG